MFKLPVCPYCHTVYGIEEVRKNKKKEIIKCYHCENKFKNARVKGYLVLAFIITFSAVIVNTVILNLTADIISSVLPILAVSFTAVLLFALFSPYFIKYKKIKNSEIKEIPSEKIIIEPSGKQKRSARKRTE